jgi:hypothetical protein
MADISPDADLGDMFSTVANDTRFEILRALWAAHTENPGAVDGRDREPVPFSRLRERVGVRDSGRFNYHLDELVPQFVRNREDGYVLTHAGSQMIGTAVSGVYTETDAELDDAVLGACSEPDCGGTLMANYDSGHITVNCDTCDLRVVMHVPPILVETHDIEANPGVVQQFTLTEMQRLVRGFCPLCSGPVENRVVGYLADGTARERVGVTHVCEECGNVSHTTAVLSVADHPAVVSLLYDAGIDYRDIALWQPPREVEFEETIESEAPVRVAVAMTADEETLTAVMDENLDVVELRRGEE